MYRVILLVAVVASAASFEHKHHFPCPHKYYHDHGPFGPHGGPKVMHERLFEDVARDLKALDDKVSRACSRHSNGGTREVIEETRYKLTTPLPGYTSSDFEIKVKGRVLYVSAHSTTGHYTEIRTLPTFVTTSGAVYTYIEGVLEVTFPVNADANTCSYTFNDDVTTVSEFKPNLGPRSGFGDKTKY